MRVVGLRRDEEQFVNGMEIEDLESGTRHIIAGPKRD